MIETSSVAFLRVEASRLYIKNRRAASTVGCCILVSWATGLCVPLWLFWVSRLFSSVVRGLYKVNVVSMQMELSSRHAVYFALLVRESGAWS